MRLCERKVDTRFITPKDGAAYRVDKQTCEGRGENNYAVAKMQKAGAAKREKRRTYMGCIPAGAHPQLFAEIQRILQAESQLSAHAADLLLASGVRPGVFKDRQRHVERPIVSVGQALDTSSFESGHGASALVQETRGDKDL